MTDASANGKWQIPASWVWTEMREVATVVGGGTPRTDEPLNFEGGNISWITPADLSGYKQKLISRGARNITAYGLENSGARMLPAGTVLFSSRAPIGYVAIAANPLSTNQGFKSFVLREGISSDYAYYYLQRAKDLALELASGTTFLEISGVKAGLIPIPLATRPEQDRIVAEIEKQFTRLDDAVAALKRVQANLKRYRTSVLKAACQGRLVPTEAKLAREGGRDYEPASELLKRILAERRAKWEADQLQRMIAAGKPSKNDDWKGRYVPPIEPNILQEPELPEGWIWASLEQVMPVFVDSAHRTPRYGPVGVPALGPRDVVYGRIILTEARLVNEEEFAIQTERRIPQVGDIVYSRELSYGWAAAIPENVRLCLSQGMCLFRPHHSISGEYILQVLNGPVGRAQATNVATGSAHPHINLGDIKSYRIPLPPTAEQSRIVRELEDRLSVIEHVDASVKKHLQNVQALRRSVLEEAFSGKLVPQDPNDEPASVLLERIRAERLSAQASKGKDQNGTNGALPVNPQRRGRAKKSARPAKAGKP